jgi:signal transduction histidine kinase/ligand-binding sensor domain-containing protein
MPDWLRGFGIHRQFGILHPACGILPSAFCIVVGLAALAFDLRAQDGPVSRATTEPASLRLERLGSEHGLSHNTVYAILQDARGFLWFGTQDGLDRFDGLEFVSHKHDSDDPRSLASSWITALLEDRDAVLWVGTRAGLHRMAPDGSGFDRVALATESAGEATRLVTALAEQPDGTLWVGTDRGLFSLDPARARVAAYRHDPANPASLANNVVQRIRVAPDGIVWVLTEAPGTPLTLNRFTGSFERIAIPATWAFEFTGEGDVWIDPRAPVSQARLRSGGGGSARARGIVALRHDSRDRLWVGTYEGLYVRDADGTLQIVPTLHLGAGALSGEVNTIVEDRAGSVWFGTFGGVLRYDPQAKPFAHLSHEPGSRDTIASNAVSAIYEGQDRRLWVGTYGAGLDEIDRAGGRVVHHRRHPGDAASLCSDYVWDIAPSHGGALWVGTTGGLCRLENGRFRAVPVPPAAVNALSLLEDPDGRVWVGTSTGLYALDPGSSAVRLVGGPDTGLTSPVDTLHRERDGRIWLASAGAGTLAVHDPATGRSAAFPITPEGIWDIASSGDGTMWLATGAGLVRFDPVSGTSDRIRPDAAAAGAVHYSALVDAGGRVWTGTNKGLVRYDPGTRAFRRYDLGDGIGNIEFNRHAAHAGPGGRLFFGGMNGITSFVASEIEDNDQQAPVVMTGIQTLSRTGERRISPFGLERLVLGPADYTVSFEFAALSYTQSAKNQYAYMLEGFDAAWVSAANRRFARYTNLPPGEYVLRVRGSNHDGIWSGQQAALAVTVLPPFWQTWWFRFAAVALVAVALALAHKIRVRRLLELERLRLRIASDLHDELGSELSGIALASSLIGREDRLTDRDRRRLADVSATAARVMTGLRDIVWYINPEQDTLESLEQRMRSAARTLLDGVASDFESRGISPVPIDMDQRRHLFLIYKELLANIVRHASARHVSIRLDATGNLLRLEVSDDGVGMEGEKTTTGTGLSSIRRRAAAMGAALEVESAPGQGTRVRLSGKMTRTRRGGARKAAIE